MRLIKCWKVPLIGEKVQLYRYGKLVAKGRVLGVQKDDLGTEVIVQPTLVKSIQLWPWGGEDIRARWFVWSQAPHHFWKLYWMRELK